MRSEERIDVFLNEVNLGKLLKRWIPRRKIREKVLNNITENYKEIKTYWHENPDLRFSQVLVNTGNMPNIPGMWYYEECSDILREQKNNMRKI